MSESPPNSLDDAILALRRRLDEMPPHPGVLPMPWATYWRIWDWYEQHGQRPEADSFHGRVRRRLARELYAAAVMPVVRL